MKRHLGYLSVLIAVEIIALLLIANQRLQVSYNGDALYDAQVAVNILEGRGYTTNEMPLYALDFFRVTDSELSPPWFNIHKFPLAVFLKAAFFSIFGRNLLTATVLYSAFWHTMTVVAIYFFVYLLTRKKYTAFLAGGFFLALPMMWYGSRYLMSGLNLTTDAFFLVVLMGALLAFYRQRSVRYLILSGAVTGLAFLNRYSALLYLPGIFIFLYTLRRQQASEVRVRQIFRWSVRYFSLYVLALTLVVSPWLWFNYRQIGLWLPSLNGLFQFFFETPLNSFVDPWYKLEYSFATNSPFVEGLRYPFLIAGKWLRYFVENIFRLFSFNGIWWLFFGALAFITGRRNHWGVWRHPLMLFLLVTVMTHMITLPFWSGNVVYFFYFFPLICLPLSLMLFEVELYFKHLQWMGGGNINVSGLSAFSSPFFILVGGLLLFYSFIQQVFERRLLEVSLMHLIMGSFAGLGFLVLLFYYNRRLAQLALLFVAVVSALGFAWAPVIGQPEEIISRWDLEERPSQIKEIYEAAPGSTVLALAPWNVVWWSNNKLFSLPLPEYPDQIYVMEENYGQTIEFIYLNKLRFYPASLRPYAWAAFDRMIVNGYAPQGYELKKRLANGLILQRQKTINTSQTVAIDVGAESASSHLIWGFGPDEDVNGISYAWAMSKIDTANTTSEISDSDQIFRGPRPIPLELSTPPQLQAREYFYPQAEITFLTDAETSLQLSVRVMSSVKFQTMEVLVNGNLLATDSHGTYLGTIDFKQSSAWETKEFVIPAAALRRGLNKLSLMFSRPDEEGRYAAFDYVRFDPLTND